MKWKILFPLLILIIISSACSTSSGSSDQSGEAVMPTSEVSGVGQGPTEEPTKAPDRKVVDEFMDEFTTMDPDWSGPFTVTTKALPGKALSKVSIEDGWLSFNIQDEETYMYEFYLNPAAADVVLETKYQPGGNHTVNGIALVCRAAEDFSSWYEFRVSSSNRYSIFLYDKSRKENDDLNPYVELAGGVSSTISPAKTNVFRAMCNGTSLVLEMNGEQVASVQDGTLQEDGLVGVGAMSSNLTPTFVKFDYLSVSKP